MDHQLQEKYTDNQMQRLSPHALTNQFTEQKESSIFLGEKLLYT